MIASLLLSAAIWPAPATQDCMPLEDTILLGIAKNTAGELLYCELVSQPQPKSLKISYIKDTKVLAEKTLQYTDNAKKPSVTQKDFRFGELRQADIAEQEIKLQYQANKQKKINSITLPISQVDVIDAGFDSYIREEWSQLQAGKTLSVNFASIPHLKTLPLRVSKQASEKCVHQESEIIFCYLVEIDNALLRLMLGKIKLTYDEQRRLRSFNGVVNILDDKQSTQSATIHYYYRQGHE